MRYITKGLAAAILAVSVTTVSADPFTVTGTLTGDIRDENPDNLIVNVTITGDTATNVVNWLIDINSPLHPNVKLDEFYFNVTGLAESYSFSGFDPTGWEVGPASVQGAGGQGTTFVFETYDPSGPPDAANVTNTQNLTFTMTLSSGLFSPAIFTGASTAISNDAGQGQLGAHLQSLIPVGQTSGTDASGFAFGNYQYTPTPPELDVPEPAILALLGIALAGMGLTRRSKHS